jgi:hypothetical protein
MGNAIKEATEKMYSNLFFKKISKKPKIRKPRPVADVFAVRWSIAGTQWISMGTKAVRLKKNHKILLEYKLMIKK